MKFLSFLLLFSFITITVQGAGIMGILDEYAHLYQSRLAAQAFEGTNGRRVPQSAISTREEELEREIGLLLRDESLRDVILGYMDENLGMDDISCFTRFINDLEIDSPVARKLGNSVRNYRRSGDRPHYKSTTINGIARILPPGAVVFDNPELDAQVKSTLPIDTQIQLTAAVNGFYRIVTSDGDVGFIHYTTIELDGDMVEIGSDQDDVVYFDDFNPQYLPELEEFGSRRSTGSSFQSEPLFKSFGSGLTRSEEVEKEGKVTAKSLNLRYGPGTSYKVIGSLSQNESVTILKTSGSWYRVRTSQNAIGWCSTQYISIMSGSGSSGASTGSSTTGTGSLTSSSGNTSNNNSGTANYGVFINIGSGQFSPVFSGGSSANTSSNSSSSTGTTSNSNATSSTGTGNNNSTLPPAVTGTSASSTNSAATGSGLSSDLSKYSRIGDQRPTYYMTAQEEGFAASGTLFGKKYDGSERSQVLTPSGSVIATVSGRFFAQLLMQGSGILKDGTGVSYVSNKRFSKMPTGCKGITATGNWVVPFHTLAVNRKVIPYNGVYYNPKIKGMKMPNGEEHDGFWFSHDTGGAFQNVTDRIDMYVFSQAYTTWMENNFAPSKSKIQLYRVDSATKTTVLNSYKKKLGK